MDEAPTKFGFLTTDFDFVGPEITEDAVLFYGRDLVVSVNGYSGREPSVWTSLSVKLPTGERTAELSFVYVHLALGPAQDVPNGAASARIASARLDRQSSALRRVLHEADHEAILAAVVACHGR
ncbi:MAG: hypothetical protein QOG53_3488 [Frankiales bacterium]|nr:hypothetical protein [Frankiales bacterium]